MVNAKMSSAIIVNANMPSGIMVNASMQEWHYCECRGALKIYSFVVNRSQCSYKLCYLFSGVPIQSKPVLKMCYSQGILKGEVSLYH
jgi:hypothetical protein